MRTIESHKINPCNDTLTIEVLDEPGAGNACHSYRVGGFDATTNPAGSGVIVGDTSTHILFQNGPICEVGVNGITHEVLLAILIDRLQGFRSGAYACRENALALTKLEEAAMWLNSRTTKRMARGVEGTHAV